MVQTAGFSGKKWKGCVPIRHTETDNLKKKDHTSETPPVYAIYYDGLSSTFLYSSQ